MRGREVKRNVGVAICLALLLVTLQGAFIAQAGSARGAETKAASNAKPIDLNAAGAQELQTVPGIGKAMAERILEFRKEHGPFRRVEDLLKVRGIGEKSFQKLRPYFTVATRK